MKREGILTGWRVFFLFCCCFFLPWKEELSISELESFHYPRFPGATSAFFVLCSVGQFWSWFRWNASFFMKLKTWWSRYGTFNNAHVYSFHRFPNWESFLLLALQVNNLRCCFLWNILSSLHLLPSWGNKKAFVVIPGNVTVLHPIVHGMTRWLCFVKWQIRQVLQSHNPNCAIPQKGFTGFASTTNDSRSSPTLKEKKNEMMGATDGLFLSL